MLGFELSGDGQILLTLVVKEPGVSMSLGSSTEVLSLGKGFHTPSLPAYPRLLHDVLIGDRSLFTRPDGLAHVWKVASEILIDKPEPLVYAKDSVGPARGCRADRSRSLGLGSMMPM